MKWKDAIFVALIFLGIGIIIGYFLHGYSTFESVRNFIIAGVSLGVLVNVVGLLAEWFKERKGKRVEEREKLEGYVRKHDLKLIDTVIKPWYENKSVNIANEPLAIEHLQIGCPDVLKLRQECETIKDALSSEENTIKEDIRNKLAPDVPPFGFNRDCTVDDIELQTYKIMENASKKFEILDNYKVHLSLFGYRVEDYNEKYIIDKKDIFRERRESIIRDKTLYKNFGTMNKNTELLYKKTEEYHRRLKQIEHDVKDRYIKLYGTCKDCKDWHKKLKSLE